ncbi:MAG TPA: phage tail protein [Kofleriaceae bacterium]|jgi:phage tail-like protein
MALVPRDDPYGSYNFEVTIDGFNGSIAVQEVGGLEAEIGVMEYRTGTEELHTRKLPGLVKYKAITLKRGLIGDLALWNWVRQGVVGTVQRASGSIILKREDGQEVMRWTFDRGWPSKWTGPSLNAKNNEVAIETIEIQVERLSADKQQPS